MGLMDTAEIGAHKVGLRLMQAVEVMQRVFLGSNSWIHVATSACRTNAFSSSWIAAVVEVSCLGADNCDPDALL